MVKSNIIELLARSDQLLDKIAKIELEQSQARCKTAVDRLFSGKGSSSHGTNIRLHWDVDRRECGCLELGIFGSPLRDEYFGWNHTSTARTVNTSFGDITIVKTTFNHFTADVGNYGDLTVLKENSYHWDKGERERYDNV